MVEVGRLCVASLVCRYCCLFTARGLTDLYSGLITTLIQSLSKQLAAIHERLKIYIKTSA